MRLYAVNRTMTSIYVFSEMRARWYEPVQPGSTKRAYVSSVLLPSFFEVNTTALGLIFMEEIRLFSPLSDVIS